MIRPTADSSSIRRSEGRTVGDWLETSSQVQNTRSRFFLITAFRGGCTDLFWLALRSPDPVGESLSYDSWANTFATTTRTGHTSGWPRIRQQVGQQQSAPGMERSNPWRDSAACTIVMQ
jgi:hypothetical protein